MMSDDEFDEHQENAAITYRSKVASHLKQNNFVDFLIKNEFSALKKTLLSYDLGEIGLANEIPLGHPHAVRVVALANEIVDSLSFANCHAGDVRKNALIFFSSVMRYGLSEWISAPILELANNFTYIQDLVECSILEGTVLERLIELDNAFIAEVDQSRLSRDFIASVINGNPSVIEYVDDQYIDHEMVFSAVSSRGAMLRAIPARLITREVVDAAIANDISAIFDAPGEMVTDDMIKKFVIDNPVSLWRVPESRRTREVCRIAMDRNPGAALHCPVEFIGKTDFMLGIQLEPGLLAKMPDSIKTREMCIDACSRSAFQVKNVPAEYIDIEFCLAVLRSSQGPFFKVPDELLPSVKKAAALEKITLLESEIPF